MHVGEAAHNYTRYIGVFIGVMTSTFLSLAMSLQLVLKQLIYPLTIGYMRHTEFRQARHLLNLTQVELADAFITTRRSITLISFTPWIA